MKSTPKQQEISIPPIETSRFKVTIVGETSLISHRFSDRSKKAMLDKQMKKAQGAKEAKNPEQDYQDSMYLTPNGEPGYPASGIKKACVDACSFIGGMTKVQARGAFYIMGDILPIKGKVQMREDIVRLGGRTADLRYRAEYVDWSMELEILHNPRVISAEAIINLIESAGFSIGIGDWRPQKAGTHGLFRVKRG